MRYEDALVLAARAHAGQLYGSEPYIHHPLRVAARVRRDDEKLVALLHDVVEDCGFGADTLTGYGVPAVVIEAVLILSRDREMETYAEYIDRAVNSMGHAGRLARAVKRADLEENLSQQFGLGGGRLRSRYLRALERLTIRDYGEDA